MVPAIPDEGPEMPLEGDGWTGALERFKVFRPQEAFALESQ